MFQISTGAFKQNKVLTRKQLIDEIIDLVERYDIDSVDREQWQRPFEDWLNGIYAYEGLTKQVLPKRKRIVRDHKKRMKEIEKERLKERRRKAKPLDPGIIRSIKRRGKNRGRK